MPIVATKELLDRALSQRYGVAAFNLLNDLTIEAILAAAAEENAPVILQTSVKTVRAYGREQLFGIFSALVKDPWAGAGLGCAARTVRPGAVGAARPCGRAAGARFG